MSLSQDRRNNDDLWISLNYSFCDVLTCWVFEKLQKLPPSRRLHVWHCLILSPALNNKEQGTSWDPEVAGGCGSGFPHVSCHLTSISSVPLLPYFIFEHFYNPFSLTSFVLSIHTPCIADRKCVVWCYPVLRRHHSEVQNWHSTRHPVHFVFMLFLSLAKWKHLNHSVVCLAIGPWSRQK